MWHLITCEYPPQPGGVSDYCRLVAEGLAAAGELVQVWCPAAADFREAPVPGVTIRRELGDLGPASLKRAGFLLDRTPQPRRLFIQWVPHGYRFRSLNLPFCWWIYQRARRGDVVELMIHEAALTFAGSVRQKAAAVIHRVMLAILLRAARKVWLSIPAWEGRCRPYTLGRTIPFRWMPIPSTIPVVPSSAIHRGDGDQARPIIGRFGNHGPAIDRLLMATLPLIFDRCSEATILLIGSGSDGFRERFLRRHPGRAERVKATGRLDATTVSQHLAACDLLLQPIPEGVTSRNTSVMAGIAHGKAVITTPSAITEPFWRETGAVVLVANDPCALADAVERLIQDEMERRRLEVAAATLYDQCFDLRHTLRLLRSAPSDSV